MRNAIKAVFFDIGGVLLRTEDSGPRSRWEARLGLAPRTIGNIVFNNPVAKKATLGEASSSDVWKEVGNILHLSQLDLESLQKDFFSGDKWDVEMLEYIRRLSEQRRVGIISNAWPSARNDFSEPLDKVGFYAMVYSYEEHFAKPDPRIYQTALNQLGVDARDALLVDDFIENVTGATEMGMLGHQFMRWSETKLFLDRSLGDFSE